jgi:hypothetical protein
VLRLSAFVINKLFFSILFCMFVISFFSYDSCLILCVVRLQQLVSCMFVLVGKVGLLRCLLLLLVFGSNVFICGVSCILDLYLIVVFLRP